MLKKDKEKLTAVIIKGNPERITPKIYKGIYEDLKKFLEKMNIEVSLSESTPYTIPPSANIWIGHSRGVDKLQFAPKETLTIKLGSQDIDSLNHPEEITSFNPQDYDKLTDEQKSKHLVLHPIVVEKIKNKIEKNYPDISKHNTSFNTTKLH